MVQVGHGRAELAEAAARQAEHAGVLPAVVVRNPDRDRARRASCGLRAWRPEPGVLHHRRQRGRRDRVEAGQAVLQAHRQTRQAQGDFALDRLSRHHPGRAGDHRPAGVQGAVRAGDARRVPGAEHELLSRARTVRRRHQGVRPVGAPTASPRRSSSKGPTPWPRCSWSRCRTPAARIPAAARLFRAGARDLRRVRRAAGLRRGDLRVRPDRVDVRL